MTPARSTGPTLLAVSEVAADWIAWSDPGRGTFLAVVAKIAFAFAHGEPCGLLPPVELVPGDRHRDRSPLRELEAASDAVPFLPRPELLVVGHAYGPGGLRTPSMAVHVALGRQAVTFRKLLHVVGDREPGSSVPTPFRRMALSWERAVRGDDNPVGVDPRTTPPNVLDPTDAARPAGTGPIAALWPSRRQRLGAARRADLELEPMALPAGFDGAYFQAAPADQWLDDLVGDEWVSLDGLHPTLPRLQTRLPGVRVGARFEGPRGGRTVALRPDRLILDSDRQRGTLTYRGSQLVDPAELEDHRVFVGVARPGAPVAWPSAADPAARRPHVLGGVPARATPDLDGTRTVTDVDDEDTRTLDEPHGPRAPIDEDTAGPATVAARDLPTPGATALPFAARRPDVPVASPVREEDDEVTAAATSVIDLAAVRAGAGLPFAGASPPGGTRPPSSMPPTSLPFATAPRSPAPVAPPPAGSAAEIPPPSTVDPASLGPPSSMDAPRTAPSPIVPGLDEETTVGGRAPHPAEALPFVPAPGGSVFPPPPAHVGGALPFAPPPVGPLPAPPPMVQPAPAAVRSEPSPGRGSEPPSAAATPTTAPGAEPRGDDVPTVTDAPLVVATLPWQIQPPKDSLTVIVKGSFDLVDGGPAIARAEPQLPTGDVFVDDEPDGPLLAASDFAVVKPRCDVVVLGRAHAPGGSSKAMQVALRVSGAGGRVDRQLTVFGDRTWQRAVVAVAPTDPAPFEAIPISWDRAFGGPGFAANPHGVGYRARPGADGVVRLPNLETPGQHVRSPDDVPAPACLAPIHPMWKARWGLLGTYDRAWFRDRWPYFPKDFDPAYFQAAPPGQRLERATGDEEYELVGLVPGRPTVKGRLPGIKVRVFAQKTAAAGGALVEIPVKLDTITFATEDARVDLVWRGWTEVSDDDAPEFARLFATTEPLSGPALTLDEVRRRLDAATNPPDEAAPAAPPPVPPTPDAPGEPDPEGDALEAELRAREAALVEGLRARGVDPEAPRTDAGPPDPRKLAGALRAAGVEEREVAEVLAALEPDREEPASPPLVIDLRRLVEDRIARKEPLAGLDLRRADLRDLDLGGQSLAGTDLGGARLDRAQLAGTDLTGANLAGAVLDDAQGRGAVLVGADLTGASLERACLAGARLEDATLAGARAPQLDLQDASAAGADFGRAILTRARLDRAALAGADFTGATVEEAVFDGASLPKARLYDVRGAESSFVECDLTNARCEGASFVHASFRRALADDSVWERADLTTATFQGASLVSSSFVRARCWKTSFNEADLSTARLRKAQLKGATLVKANLFEAGLERADLELADLRGANLHGAALVRTRLEHARLEHAITSYSALGRKQP